MSYNVPLLVTVKPGESSPGVVLNRTGNTAYVSLEEPITLPPDAKNVSLGLRRFTYFYNFPNIDDGEKIKLVWTDDDWKTTEDLCEVEFTRGLYDIAGFASAVQTSLGNQVAVINNALGTSFSGGGEVLKFEPNWATERVEVIHGFGDWIGSDPDRKIKMVMTPTIVEITGFEEETVIDSGTQHTFLAPGRAMFNVVNSLLVRTNLLTSPGHTTSILNASNVGDVIELIPIDVKPSYQGIFNQVLSQKIPITLPQNLSRFTVSVQNENGEDIVMADQWSVLLSLYFDLP